MPAPAGWSDTPPVTLDDLKRQLNRAVTDTTDDVELQLYLDAAVEAVENILDGPVQVKRITETHRANRAGVILPHKQPVVSVASLSYGGSALDAGAYTVDLGAGTVALGYWGTDPYTLVYDAGYANLPAGFRLAILIIAQHLWRTQHGGTRTRAGDDPVMMPGMSFAIPARAAELLRAGTTPAVA
ncbi:head-tail connector protein [Micromonospora fulviviridis]|uniref:head-tail connector protein n=1 Tax=Micromonospora fulviviridis TaxID=47860 RepID=UPI0037AFD54C